MALTVDITYTIVDDAGKESEFTIHAQTGFTLADYFETARGMAEFFDNVIHGRFNSVAEICVGVDMSTIINNVLVGTADVEEIGSFVFATASGTKSEINVPCFDEQFVLAGSHEIDTSAGAVASFLTNIETGNGTVAPCDIGELDLTTLLSATEKFRNTGGSL